MNESDAALVLAYLDCARKYTDAAKVLRALRNQLLRLQELCGKGFESEAILHEIVQLVPTRGELLSAAEHELKVRIEMERCWEAIPEEQRTGNMLKTPKNITWSLLWC